jgi:hypothetical protein
MIKIDPAERHDAADVLSSAYLQPNFPQKNKKQVKISRCEVLFDFVFNTHGAKRSLPVLKHLSLDVLVAGTAR